MDFTKLANLKTRIFTTKKRPKEKKGEQGVDAPLLGVFDVKNPCCKTHKQNLRVPRTTNIGIHGLVLLLTGSNLMQPKINLCIFAYSKIVPY